MSSCREWFSFGAMTLLVELSSGSLHGQSRNNKNTRCEEIHNLPHSNSFRILVVGSGLTGVLTALRIRQRLESEQKKINSSQKNYLSTHERKKITINDRNIEVHVVERATYPAGRFGAMTNYQTCIADIGAQVLSTVNPYDPRAMGGHGIGLSDIELSNVVVQDLLSSGLLRPAPNQSLSHTDERMIWEDLWQHYLPTKSMKDVLEFILKRANTQPNFGIRIDSIKVDDSGNKLLQVKGISRVACSNSKLRKEVPFSNTYNCVVFCIPAPDVCAISGILDMLDRDSRMVLENVEYDQRTCEAHFFSSKLLPFLSQAFGSAIEQNVDEESVLKKESVIQYISLQNAKRHQLVDMTENKDEVCSVVLHGKAGHLFSREQSKSCLDQKLSALTGLSEAEISSYRLCSKSISWKTSQMVRPMESIISDPPNCWQCLKNSNGTLILAGDYMTQSSFLGCIATADAAARVVLDTILTKNSGSRS